MHPDIDTDFTPGKSSFILFLHQKAIFSQAGPYFIQYNLIYAWEFAKNITAAYTNETCANVSHKEGSLGKSHAVGICPV